MNIVEFIKNFKTNRLNKSEISDRLRIIRQKLEEVVKPTLKDVQSNSTLLMPNNKYCQDFLRTFEKFKGNTKENSFEIIDRVVDNAIATISKLDDLIINETTDTFYIDGIDYQKASVLRLVTLLDFLADYASKQLCYYVSAEVKNDSKPFTKAEESEILSKQHTYFTVLLVFSKPADEIMKEINQLPEVLVNTQSPTQVKDSLKLNYIPLVTPFFTFIGKRMADWDFERYERARKERKQIEMQIELLRQRAAGNIDARTEAVIKGYEKELTLTRERIARMEEKAGIR